jgi:hypothetical protein
MQLRCQSAVAAWSETGTAINGCETPQFASAYQSTSLGADSQAV